MITAEQAAEAEFDRLMRDPHIRRTLAATGDMRQVTRQLVHAVFRGGVIHGKREVLELQSALSQRS